MADTGQGAITAPAKDERIKETSGLRKALIRPELGAIVGTIAALEENGMAGALYFGTFDLGDEIVRGIKEGIIEWGIDQQPFLQAYLPIVVLTNYHRYGVLPGNNINSGPGFVTADGLEMVEEFAGEYR